MAQGGVVEIPPDFVPLEHVQRGMKNADCRTPVILFGEDGDPYLSLCKIARETDSAVWYFDFATTQDVEHTLGYIEIGSNNGDWVLIMNCGGVGQQAFRDIALMVFCLKPEPKKYPRREFFRLIFCVEKAFDIDQNVDIPFPPLILKNSIAVRRADGSGK
ncbi:Ankyrin repeats (3 copies) [Trypanosoma brucei equiperdum]|nr:Ankyrin repeats (3 copies) [Trypanosoma brucei equiperdum]